MAHVHISCAEKFFVQSSLPLLPLSNYLHTALTYGMCTPCTFLLLREKRKQNPQKPPHPTKPPLLWPQARSCTNYEICIKTSRRVPRFPFSSVLRCTGQPQAVLHLESNIVLFHRTKTECTLCALLQGCHFATYLFQVPL